jgi:hypothetical protein
MRACKNPQRQRNRLGNKRGRPRAERIDPIEVSESELAPEPQYVGGFLIAGRPDQDRVGERSVEPNDLELQVFIQVLVHS